MTDKKEKSLYFENLDGFRAVAALAVVLYHSEWLAHSVPEGGSLIGKILTFNSDGGTLGVKFFFVLSGYLITYLLLRESQKCGKIRLAFFYYRRFLRIWPLYFASLLIGFVVYPVVVAPAGFEEKANPLLYWLFLANFDPIYNAYPTCGILGVQWSVAIEEQFYLFWPLFIMLVLKLGQRLGPVAFLLLTLASEVFFLAQPTWELRNFHLFSTIRFLSFGGLLGYLTFSRLNWFETAFKRLNKITTFLIYLVCLAIMFIGPEYREESAAVKGIVHLLPFLFFGFVIVEQNFSSASFFKMKNVPFLTYLGKISYGLYSLHMVAVYIILSTPFLNKESLYLPNVALLVFLTIGISHISYFGFESRFLKLKKKFSPLQPSSEPSPE